MPGSFCFSPCVFHICAIFFWMRGFPVLNGIHPWILCPADTLLCFFLLLENRGRGSGRDRVSGPGLAHDNFE